MKIKVEQRHIDNGKVDGYHCPIALAIKEKQHKAVAVWYCNLYIYDKEVETKYILPLKARDFINRFDKRDKVEPFEFDIVPARPY